MRSKLIYLPRIGMWRLIVHARCSQSIKIDIGKSFDKSISIDKLNLNDIDFIG